MFGKFGSNLKQIKVHVSSLFVFSVRFGFSGFHVEIILQNTNFMKITMKKNRLVRWIKIQSNTKRYLKEEKKMLDR